MTDHPVRLSRRQALQGAFAGLAGTHAGQVLAGDATPPPAVSSPPGLCLLAPQAVEGPYYFDPKLVRADITDGRPGLPLDLELRILESGPCTAIANARVDIWHADAGGVYSGYAGQGDDGGTSTEGKSYLRGTQITNETGTVQFITVYPGWYPGRTPHIHLKVYLDEKTVLIGQVYFPDDVSARIYKAHEAYAMRPVADTTNTSDFLFQHGQRDGGGIVLAVAEENGRVRATLLIGVDRSGNSARRAEGWGGYFQRVLGSR